MGWEEQGTIFAVCSLFGVLVGIGADGYRAWQTAIRKDRKVVAVLDCLLWCVLAAFVCVLMVFLNGGDMRSYVFLALVVGYFVYRRLVGDRIIRLWLWCACAVQTVCRRAWRILTVLCAPLRWCMRIADSMVRWLLGRLAVMRKSPPDEKS